MSLVEGHARFGSTFGGTAAELPEVWPTKTTRPGSKHLTEDYVSAAIMFELPSLY